PGREVMTTRSRGGGCVPVEDCQGENARWDIRRLLAGGQSTNDGRVLEQSLPLEQHPDPLVLVELLRMVGRYLVLTERLISSRCRAAHLSRVLCLHFPLGFGRLLGLRPVAVVRRILFPALIPRVGALPEALVVCVRVVAQKVAYAVFQILRAPVQRRR